MEMKKTSVIFKFFIVFYYLFNSITVLAENNNPQKTLEDIFFNQVYVASDEGKISIDVLGEEFYNKYISIFNTDKLVIDEEFKEQFTKTVEENKNLDSFRNGSLPMDGIYRILKLEDDTQLIFQEKNYSTSEEYDITYSVSKAYDDLGMFELNGENGEKAILYLLNDWEIFIINQGEIEGDGNYSIEYSRFLIGFKGSETVVEYFTEKNEELLTSLDESQEIYKSIDRVREMTQSYADLVVMKEAAAASSGDYTLLNFDNEEYQRIMREHNNLINKLGLDRDLEITFNNTDHVTTQIRKLNDEIDELEIKRMKMDAKSLSEGYEGIPTEDLATDFLLNSDGDSAKRVRELMSQYDNFE